MPFDVRVEATVARSPEDVAAYMFDPRHDPDWITGIEHVDPPVAPVAVGTETHRLRAAGHGAHPRPPPGHGIGEGAVSDGRHLRDRA